MIQPAMDHLIANTDNPVPAADQQGASTSNDDDVDEEDKEALAAHIQKMGGTVDGPEQVAQSIKCSECGKIFRSQGTASFHAEKTGHQEFEESTEEVGHPPHTSNF